MAVGLGERETRPIHRETIEIMPFLFLTFLDGNGDGGGVAGGGSLRRVVESGVGCMLGLERGESQAIWAIESRKGVGW